MTSERENLSFWAAELWQADRFRVRVVYLLSTALEHLKGDALIPYTFLDALCMLYSMPVFAV